MINRKVFAALGFAMASLIALSSAQADDIDQATKLTFSQPVQIPGKVLPAGTYWFVVDVGPNSGSNTVRIFGQDRLALYATLQTISAEQTAPAENTEITFADRASIRPEAIVTWFYPGRTIGHEFLYSKQEEKEIAQAKQYTVVGGKVFSNQLPKQVAQAKQGTMADGE
jgi:hypothetical protein